jgi:hypothetical protein
MGVFDLSSIYDPRIRQFCGALAMAAKDVFDIADHRSGNGHPLWLKTHPPTPHTATAVDRLLAAGAHMVGRTHSDEMAYSLDGENVHLWHINPKALDRIPGGSSSGLGSGRAGASWSTSLSALIAAVPCACPRVIAASLVSAQAMAWYRQTAW